MKTFKLVALQTVNKQEERQQIELTNGLIINKEDEENNWVIEAVIDKHFHTMFELLLTNKEKIKVEATISKKTNDPATFLAIIVSITPIGEHHISILMNGILLERRLHFAEVLLANLIEQGLTGSNLLAQFKHNLRNKGIKNSSSTK
ncbi:hypothetical protein FZC66_13550 [Priestia megaterium]|nr:hypothetical protein FZC66_13550 [Priestia megaterium]